MKPTPDSLGVVGGDLLLVLPALVLRELGEVGGSSARLPATTLVVDDRDRPKVVA
jgi:hypothetical protein